MCANRFPTIVMLSAARRAAEQHAEPVFLVADPSSCGGWTRCSGSAKMLLLNVMLSCGPQVLAISSMAQLNEQWSMTTFVTGLIALPSSLSASRFAGSGPLVSSPVRTRMCWIRMCEAWMLIAAPRIMMPGDGAVWPAIVSAIVADHEVGGEADGARHFEHADARSRAVDAGLERARAAGVEVGDLDRRCRRGRRACRCRSPPSHGMTGSAWAAVAPTSMAAPTNHWETS